MIRLTFAEELAGVFWAFTVGAALAAFYDLFRILRLMTGLRSQTGAIRKTLPLVGDPVRERSRRGALWTALVALEDLAYFAVASAVYVVFVFNAGYGYNRWFFTLGAIAGFAAYFATLGRLVMRASGAVRFVLCAAFAYARFFAALPFRLLTSRMAS